MGARRATKKITEIKKQGPPDQPLPNQKYETILQAELRNPQMNSRELAEHLKLFGKDTYIRQVQARSDYHDRKLYLITKTTNKTIDIRRYVIDETINANEAQKKSKPGCLQSRLLDILARTQAMYTDNIELKGLPKRLIIRTGNCTEEITSSSDGA